MYSNRRNKKGTVDSKGLWKSATKKYQSKKDRQGYFGNPQWEFKEISK
jgi:hypothetical protein